MRAVLVRVSIEICVVYYGDVRCIRYSVRRQRQMFIRERACKVQSKQGQASGLARFSLNKASRLARFSLNRASGLPGSG